MAVGDYSAVTPSTFVSPLEAGQSFYFDSAHTIYPYFHTATGQQNIYYQKVTAPDGTECENKYKWAPNGAASGESGSYFNAKSPLPCGRGLLDVSR